MNPPRRHPRTSSISFLVEVTSYSAGLATQDEGRLVVLGAGGAFVELNGSYAVGHMLRLGFKLPSAAEEISCTAIVRSRLEAQGVGVEFLHLDPRDRERISTFVQQQLSE